MAFKFAIPTSIKSLYTFADPPIVCGRQEVAGEEIGHFGSRQLVSGKSERVTRERDSLECIGHPMSGRERVSDGTPGLASNLRCVRTVKVQPRAETLVNPFARSRRFCIMRQDLQPDSAVRYKQGLMLLQEAGLLERVK